MDYMQMTPCYTDACALRDTVSGEWFGAAAECNAGAPFCEPSLPIQLAMDMEASYIVEEE